MSATGIVVIVVAVIVVVALLAGLMTALRRRRLRGRFGPEYDRLVGQRGSRLRADAELTRRVRRVRRLDIRPLADEARAILRSVGRPAGGVRRQAERRAVGVAGARDRGVEGAWLPDG